MSSNQFALLGDRRFLPLFLTQFAGAFHDNLFKNALVVLILYVSARGGTHDPKVLTTLAMATFILPFVLLSALGGEISDKYPKHRVIRVIKAAEIAIAGTGFAALVSGSMILSFATLFALGCHSAFFGPTKYSILPQHLEERELIAGNALLNTGTFLAILVGTIAGALLITAASGTIITGTALIACALFGYVACRRIPDAPALAPELRINANIFAETWATLRDTLQRPRGVVLSILGISWFYFIGGMFMAQLPNFTREILGANEQVLTFLFVVFSVGVALGGLFNNRLLRGHIEATYVPLAILGMSVFAIDLYFASGHVAVADGGYVTLAQFVAAPQSWRIVADIAFIAAFGGLFEVPLSAIVQHFTPPEIRARVQAGNAILNALFMVASSVLAAGLISAGMDVRKIFLVFAAANACVAIYTCRLLPDYFLKSLLQGLFKLLYNVEVRGLENYEKAGKRAVIVGNHVSLLDPPLLAAFLPGTPMFAVDTHVANWWWVKPFLRLVDAFPLDPANPFSMKALIRKVEEDRHIVIFPEGRLTETGSLMKVYDGPGMIADKADAVILPIRLDGVQHTPFARLKGKVPLRTFPKITITILEPRKFTIDPALRGRARRAAAGRQLYDLMEEMMFLTGDREQTLFQALMKAWHVNGKDALIVEDAERQAMRFDRLITGACILGRKFAALSEPRETMGLMLPNSAGAVVAFFGLQAVGRVPAMINFSAGTQAVLSACRTASIRTVITSRRFIELARLGDLVDALVQQVRLVYLEDLRASVSMADKIAALLGSLSRLHAACGARHTDPAVVLFTSGSEGEPKGVVLSHGNLMTNIVQLASRVDFNRQDVVFNCLPMFHSFGLTGGTLLPVLSGIRTFLYPSPLHYRIVPELVYASNATIMFGTDTFLNGYARMADPYDFYRMRYIFAGAEKVKDETRRLYMERFGVQVLEGYGATETSPALAVNSAMHKRSGSVGRFLAGITYKLEPVPGVDEGGRLYVRGPNVMLGYYLAANPGVLVPPEAGWHDTGDIVSVDEGGFVRILGRAKRFAKIAGEMVSLAKSEAIAEAVWPAALHAVVAVPDARKGEQLVLVTTQAGAARDALSGYAAAHGIAALAVPATIRVIEKMPVLGSGKTDYTAVKALATGG